MLILILTDTGLRINEALNLKLEHINDSQIIIKNGKGKKIELCIVHHLYINNILNTLEQKIIIWPVME